MNYHIKLHTDTYYHLFSRANGSERLFKVDDNYAFFLSKTKLHVSSVADVLAWCLLPNHFHLLIRVKSEKFISESYKRIKRKALTDTELLPDFIMERFSNLLNSYTKAFNKVYNRKGALFMDYLRRVEIKENSQLCATLFYIHKNPVHHGVCNSINNWEWSSYKEFLHNDTFIYRDEVMEWFSGKEGFIDYHQQPIFLKNAVMVVKTYKVSKTL